MEETMMATEEMELCAAETAATASVAPTVIEAAPAVAPAEPLPTQTPAWHDLLLVSEGAVIGVVSWELGKWLGRKLSDAIAKHVEKRKEKKAAKAIPIQETTEG